MLTNLKVEYVRKSIEPCKGIVDALGCTQRTAKNKLDGLTPITVSEACKIIEPSFKSDNFPIEYLFAADSSFKQ